MATQLEDYKDAAKAGYRFLPTIDEAISLIDIYFDGFDIKSLVGDIENLLAPHAKPPVEREIEINNPPPWMRFDYRSDNYLDEKEGLYISRVFKYDGSELIVEHEMQQLPDSCRKQGIGKKLMSSLLAQYEIMDVKRIDLYAALSDGGAVWAKFGFKATRRAEMERILQRAEKQLGSRPKILQTVIDTFNNYYEMEPKGDAFPIGNWANIPGMEEVLKMPGCHWHGRIDLTNKKDLRNFKIYVGQ